MILVSLLGMDIYQAEALSKKMHQPLVNAFSCADDDLNFYSPSSFLIHNGVEQTSYRLEVIIHAPDIFQDKEKAVIEVLEKFLKEISVHQHIVFHYFETEHEVTLNDENYPLYMTESNVVKADNYADNDGAERTEEETYEEPYYGDIISEFDEYVKSHPDATDREVYEVLSGIREKVTKEHHESEKKK